jgi:hypothetical protein
MLGALILLREIRMLAAWVMILFVSKKNDCFGLDLAIDCHVTAKT